ncbi:hypothetical protein PEC18_18775 [Paucibacter sp. O1-1]|nr:hypothetical protein [Paucibacter sp. O1-1]MDA3827842.1 hypothetical protein [Paucibacter sp. O1-1]
MADVKASAPRAPDEWEIREDMRTLIRAKEIQSDPKRLARAKAMARKELENLKKVTGATEAVASDKK